MKHIVVAVDGPAGAGKSSVCKEVAKKLNITYIDTGAMYRACALMALETGVDVRRETPMMRRMFEDFDLRFENNKSTQKVILNDVDITREIREPHISNGASYISAIPYVRDKMVELQRKMAESCSVLMDGRDIGTNVFPNADVKIFLTAKPEQRAKRRFEELIKKGVKTTFEEVLDEINKRDKNDSEREYAPLKVAEDAVVIDTTDFTFSQSVEAVLSHISKFIGE